MAFGPRVGLEPTQLAATVVGTADDPAWSERDRLLVRLVNELHDTATVSDRLWEALRIHWSVPELLELLFVVDWYHAISYLANSARVELEDWRHGSARCASSACRRARPRQRGSRRGN